ncbi:MAG: hypothetical protein H7319_08120 [Spirosoma sp.]|nr:hypothetical protein [Spirosoma sp.]
MKTLCIPAWLTFALATITLLGQPSQLVAQTPPTGSGVYLTVADYKQGKLALQVDCKTEKHRIRLHDFFGSASIDVIHNGEKHTFQKDNIYGIRDCDGKDYRFVSREEYQMLESRTITIYEKLTVATSTTGKGIRTVELVYFSLQPDSDLLPLTVANLKKALPANHKFHDLLDENFRLDADAVAYDPTHKMYKVNHLLQTAP